MWILTKRVGSKTRLVFTIFRRHFCFYATINSQTLIGSKEEAPTAAGVDACDHDGRCRAREGDMRGVPGTPLHR